MKAVIPAKTGPTIYPLTRGKLAIANEFDEALGDDRLLWDHIVYDQGPGLLNPHGVDQPWVTMPSEGRAFRKIGSLPVTSTTFDGVQYTVLTFQVPVGFDGVIQTIVANMDGPNGVTGFVEGSGTVTWSLSANSRYLHDLGAVIFSVGSLINPIPTVTSGYRIYSGNIITFSVAFSTAGAGVINLTASSVCACYGWFYPR